MNKIGKRNKKYKVRTKERWENERKIMLNKRACFESGHHFYTDFIDSNLCRKKRGREKL